MNKTLSKIISLFLAIIVTVGMVSLGNFTIEAEALTYGDFEYDIKNDEYVTITKYNGTDAVVEVPSVLGNRPVRVIGNQAFRGIETLVEVTIPSSVEKIDREAFIKCTSLKKVNLSEGLIDVYDYAFNFTQIERLEIPSTVQMFSMNGVWDSAIKEIVFAEEYANRSFLNTNWVDYPVGAEVVFKGIPNVNTDIDLRNFGFEFNYRDSEYRYKKRSSDTPEETVLTGGDYQYTLKNGEATIVRCTAFDAEEIVVPSVIGGYPVTEIGDFAFSAFLKVWEDWNDLEFEYDYMCRKVTIPEGVRKIGRYAFAECYNLVEVILPESLESFGYCAFMKCRKLEKINIPEGIEILPDRLFYGSYKVKTTLPDSLRVICDYAFYFTGIEKWTNEPTVCNAYLPDTVEYLGAQLFARAAFIDELTLPKNLKQVHGTFEGMLDLKRINFNDSLEVIGKDSFRECFNLEEAIIPDSVNVIGSTAFNQCEGLRKVYIPSNVTQIRYRTFYNCISLDFLEWNPKEKRIEQDAFYGCPLRGFDFTNTYGIADGAFYGSNIEVAKIGKGDYEPEEKQSIGTQSFMRCNELETVSLGGNVNEIGTQAFAECENLETVVIADSVERIADNAFEGSEKVTIYCFADSYAETFAIENKIKVTTLVIAPIPNQTYTTKEIKPELTVSMSSHTLGKNEYSTDYYNNVNVGTASVVVTGKGDFDMLVSKADFAIVAKNIADVQIAVIRPQVYENIAVTPTVDLKYNGIKLAEGKDYSLSYDNNTSVGTGTVKIKGIGNYRGTVSVDFEITEEKPSAVAHFIQAIADFFLMIWNLFFVLIS